MDGWDILLVRPLSKFDECLIMETNKITWDWGTAYDFFISLRVLHDPGRYGLRPSWAAGVRSRVPPDHREFLEETQSFMFVPLKWIHTLPPPKNGETVLWMIGQIPPEERLLTLMDGSGIPGSVVDILKTVIERGSWRSEDLDTLREAYPPHRTPPRSKSLSVMLDLFAKPRESGERYIDALRSYQRVFFTEEEEYIQQYLDGAIAKARELSEQLTFDELIELLSRGVRLGAEPAFDEWVFTPSYWISPLVSFERLSENRSIFVFGCRPQDVSLVPGDVVPEGLLRTVKSLGDPTRLRILRYLSQENITPAEISRRLRLRAPTVTHHLNVLRLAGLVYLTLDEKNERSYAARLEAFDELFASLKEFLVELSDDNK